MEQEWESAPEQSRPFGLGELSAMLLLAVMWGLSIPATKLGLQTMPPLALTTLRFAIALPVLLCLALRRTRIAWRSLPAVAGLGLLGIGIGQFSQTFGVAGTSASVGTILSATIPVFVVFFAAIRLKQSISVTQVVGIAAAFGGIVLVALGNRGEAGAGSTTLNGVLWMLGSSLAIAAYYVWSVVLTALYGTVPVAAWSTFFGFLALLPAAVWESYRAPLRVTPQAVGSAAYLGLVVTVAGLFLWLNILRTVPARIAANVQFLQPVVGIAASAVLFGDRIGAQFVG